MQSARLIWAEGESLDIGRDMRSGGVTGIHPARDGYIYISANTPHFWRALCEKTGLMALHDNPRYDSVKKRAEHRDEIVPQLREALATRTAREWEAVFGESVPCSASRTVADMFDDPQVQAEAMRYLPWLIAAPVIGIASWILDGIFIGALLTREMLRAMLVSVSLYAVALLLLIPTLGNHGLWLALMLLNLTRAITLWRALPALTARLA